MIVPSDAARFFSTDPALGALLDRNGDGVADELRVRLVVMGTPTEEEWIALLGLAARLGLETSGLTLPLAFADTRAVPAGALPLVCLTRPVEGADAAVLWTLPDVASIRALVGIESAGAPVSLPVAPLKLDLARFYEHDGALADDDGDLFPERVRLCFLVPRHLPAEIGRALLDLAARLGLEATGLRLPLAVPEGSAVPEGALPLRLEIIGTPLVGAVEGEDDAALRQGEGVLDVTAGSDGVSALVVYGDEAGIANVLRELAASWPHLHHWDAAAPCAADLAGALALTLHGEDEAGRAAIVAADLAVLASTGTPTPAGELRLLTAEPLVVDAARVAVARHALPLDITVAPDDRLAFVDEWTDEWEVERARRAVREQVLPALDSALPAEITVMISEPASIRQALAAELGSLALPPGSMVRVLSAFKPGLCWLLEVVGPRWAARGGIGHVLISYRPFAAPEPGRFLDLPIRHLQELYPGDEMLAAMLRLPLAAITLIEEADLTETYRATAFDSVGQEIETLAFSAYAYARDYISGAPEQGRVTVTSGAMIAMQAGRTIVELPLPTDLDRFWDHYQAAILPRLRALIAEETDGTFAAEAQPFFEALDIEVWCSVTDEALGVREELLSAAEALQQDLYFGTLDTIAALGAGARASGTNDSGKGGDLLDAPGAVRPFVHLRLGHGPKARIVLRRRLRHLATLSSPSGAKSRQFAVLPVDPRPAIAIRSLRSRVDRPGFSALGLEMPGDPFLATVARHLWLADAKEVKIGAALQIGGGRVMLELPLPVPYFIESGGVVELPQTPLDVEGLQPLLAQLTAYPGVVVRRVGRSFEGRPIAAIEIFAPGGGTLWSRRKLSLHKPTLLVIARHHANEPASTHAALRLAERCATDPDYQRLLARANVVILPLENVDGAALHATMWREHPTWKLHAARYNAVGREFARDYYDRETRWGEARVRPRLWDEWLPDLVVDNHGVPSHEWNQHFNGFGSPPRFGISYWLVSALLYGIVRYPTAAPAHVAFAHAARDRISGAVAEDEAISAANATLRDRYERWGHERLPERFPAEYHRNMLWFFGPQVDGGRAHPGRPAAYDRLTVADIVTEVPDETAQGDYLALVAHAHLVANAVLLRLLAESELPIERRVNVGTIILSRERPLRPPG